MTKRLTTAQHAHLLTLQQAVENAIRERDGFVQYLSVEHDSDARHYSLDLGLGEFVPLDPDGVESSD